MPHTDALPWSLPTCRCESGCGCEPTEQGCLCSSGVHRMPSKHPGRVDGLRRALARLAGAIAVLGLVAACGLQTAEPAHLDLATQRPSEHGAYRVSYRSQATPNAITHQPPIWNLRPSTK